MSEIPRCPQCGAELPPDAPSGVCPRCVYGLGFGQQSPDSSTRSAPTPPRTPHERFVPPEPDDLARHFPQLEILELLGSGGMGAVYKARQRRLDRLVALKILPPEVARHPGFEERFTREARALGRLNDPHIVTLHDFGIAGGLYYFLMEFVDGVNLRQMIAGGELSPREALAIVPQVCDALQYAHDEGIVHRDIKPENILLDKKGRVKIADFGLAKLMRDSDDPAGRADLALTGSQQVMGTPHYMAPEQMKRPLGVDHRADIFSLGVVFYEMLTGELPLGRFAPPSRMVEIDVRLDEVVLRSLEKEPELRYQHASDVKSDVENISWDKPAPFNAKPGDKDDLDELGRRGEPSFFAKLADAREPDGLLELFRSLVKESWLQYLLISVACCLCAIVVVSAWRSWTHPTGPVPFAPMPYSESVPPVLESLPPHAMPLYSPFWELTPDGPRLTDEFVQNVLKLSPSQIAQTNKILKAHYEDGLEIESRHLERQTDALGHVIVSIRPYLGPTMQLEDLLWSELDLILDPKQQDLARLNLKLEPRKFTSAMPIPTSELAGPGFFGWGKDGAKIELWRVGSWFQWHVESRGTSDSGRARELPAYYRHFWDQSANDRRGAN